MSITYSQILGPDAEISVNGLGPRTAKNSLLSYREYLKQSVISDVASLAQRKNNKCADQHACWSMPLLFACKLAELLEHVTVIKLRSFVCDISADDGNADLEKSP